MIRKLGQVAVVLGATVAVVLGVRPAFATAEPLPFSASYSGSAAFTSQTTVSFLGSGTATHMGRITIVGTVVLNGPDGSCSGGIANVNTETLTDRDGDTLTISSQDVACPTGPNQFRGTGQWTVTGGTGRFAATGQGLADGGSDFNAGTFTMALSGTIRLPDSQLTARCRTADIAAGLGYRPPASARGAPDGRRRLSTDRRGEIANQRLGAERLTMVASASVARSTSRVVL